MDILVACSPFHCNIWSKPYNNIKHFNRQELFYVIIDFQITFQADAQLYAGDYKNVRLI